MDATGERSFLTDRGASVHLGHVESEVLDEVDVLHVPLYSLLTGALAESAYALIGEALERNISVTISTSSLSALREFGRTEFLSLIKNMSPDVVFANQPEARYVLKGHPWFVGAGSTVVTAGERAARLTRPDGSDYRRVPESVDVRDTTGAGDAFTAGFLVAWGSGADPEACLVAGHSLAARVLGEPGAHLAMDKGD